MELSNQIKKYRTNRNLSQEELAEKIYVTRQTISNWENEKSYPDIHSLLLLSSVFDLSLDQLIKGDLEIMREEINKEEIKSFNHDSVLYSILLLIFILTAVPLAVFFKVGGIIISALLWLAAMYYAFRLEKYKKRYDIRTYREIVAFMEGTHLDEIEKAKECGKRPYQEVLLIFLCALFAFIVCLVLIWLLKPWMH